MNRTSAGRPRTVRVARDECDGHVDRTALAEDVTDDLPGERGRVEAPLARQDQRRAGERLAEPDDSGNELGPRDKTGAERREAAGEAARSARAGQLADVDAVVGPVAVGELRQPALQLRDRVRVRSLPRSEDRGGVDEHGRHIACDKNLRATKVELERLERPEATVDGRRSADRDEDAAGALVQRGADQLPVPTVVARSGSFKPETRARPLARAISTTAVSPRMPHSASTGAPSGPVTRPSGARMSPGRGRRASPRRRPRAAA